MGIIPEDMCVSSQHIPFDDSRAASSSCSLPGIHKLPSFLQTADFMAEAVGLWTSKAYSAYQRFQIIVCEPISITRWLLFTRRVDSPELVTIPSPQIITQMETVGWPLIYSLKIKLGFVCAGNYPLFGQCICRMKAESLDLRWGNNFRMQMSTICREFGQELSKEALLARPYKV